MFSFWALIILGIVQGITEFLPISSSGHLVLLSKLFGIENSLLVSIILHFATLLSVVFVLRKEVWQILKHPFGELSRKIIFATIPTCLIVLLIFPFITQSFEGTALPFCFMVTAFMLFLTDIFQKNRPAYSQSLNISISYKQALFIGIGQGLATFPGISRSGTTICAGVFAGGGRESVAKFSFLMSIPVILLSMGMEVFKLSTGEIIPKINVLGIIFGFMMAFITGLLSVKFMIKITQKLNFRWFALYLAVISILTLLI